VPELPEVETIRRGLAEVLPGKAIKQFEVRLPKVFQNAGAEGLKRLLGAKVISVNRRGKLLLIELSTGMTLAIHLKMTGQLIFRENKKLVLAGGHPIPTVTGELPAKVTHAIFTFSGGSELFYNDQRQFGYIKFLPTDEVAELPLMKTFGPEPLERSFTFEKFEERLLRRPNAKLKPLLLDQTFVAGLGNIYTDESLNLAKLHPLRTVGSLNTTQRKILFKSILKILRYALKHQGTSDNTYVLIGGGKGNYRKYARVYHREGQPCRACGTPIRRTKVVGRGTYYCPKCQRPPTVR
jgi:formamidopyrimidine-DNA glycosylase